jgi:hypothetical protein
MEDWELGMAEQYELLADDSGQLGWWTLRKQG